METLTSLMTTVDERVSQGQDTLMLHAGSVAFTPRWKDDHACDMGGWYEDIHGTLLAPVTTNWNALKPYVYLNVFLPEDRNDPEYGYIYAGKDEKPAEGKYTIVDRTYSGSPGKTNVWRSIVNRAEPHEIYKRIVSVYDSADECRAAEKRLIEHLWDRFGRVEDGGLVTNLVTDINGRDRNLSPEECRAISERQKGQPNGSGQSVYVREADGTEHILDSSTDAVKLVMGLTAMERERAHSLVRGGIDRNKESLKVHEETGLLICYTKNKDKPMRITPGERLVRVEDTVDGTVEVMTADKYMERFAKTRKQLGATAKQYRSKGYLLRGRYAVSWADGEIRAQVGSVPIFDRNTGEYYDRQKLLVEGFNPSGARRAAHRNRVAPYAYHAKKAKGHKQDYFKVYFVFEEDLEKPVTPPLLETPTVLLERGRVDGADVFVSGGVAARSLGVSQSGVSAGARTNSALIASGELPSKWRMCGGTHVPVNLHDLPAYCELTGQEMPFSLMPYVADIAKWQAENPRPSTRASKSAKA